MIGACHRCGNEYRGKHSCPPDDRERAIANACRWFSEEWVPDVPRLEARLDAALAMEPERWSGPVTVYR